MAIPRDETEIVGRWSEIHGEIQPDAECRRIERLMDSELEQLTAALDGRWDTLYRDPEDGRLWECVYEDSSFHGAGPPTLRVISSDQAREKYGWSAPEQEEEEG